MAKKKFNESTRLELREYLIEYLDSREDERATVWPEHARAIEALSFGDTEPLPVELLVRCDKHGIRFTSATYYAVARRMRSYREKDVKRVESLPALDVEVTA